VLFPVFATSTPVFGDDKSLVAMITVATDITDRKRAEDQARRLSAIVESSSDAIVGMSLEQVITSWNPGATALFGYDATEALGQKISMLAASQDRIHALTRLGAAQGMSLTNIETQCLTKDGALLEVSLSISPILDELGEPIGLSGIGRDITERVELEQVAEKSRQELAVAQRAAELEALERDEANRANRAKSEFLSRMSHELRTPLNAVLGFGQLLLMGDLTVQQRENVDFIRSAGEHLLDLINDVLDISRIEAGALKLSLESVDVADVAVNALSLIRPQAARNNISIPTEILGCDELYVQSDRQRLLQVLLNLLSNAVKYNRPNGRIELCCQSSGGTVSIAVSDTGIGMCEADLGKLFTPFERLGAEATDIEGTGVGLALSRVLSQQMGGALTVFSTVGTGSTFTLELPASQAPGPTVASGPTVDPVAAGTLKLVTVLAIEDNVANIRLLERAMQLRENVVLLTAIQGRLGLELAAQHHPDLILLDLHLPDLPGEIVLQHLCADPATSAIPVVICSADATPNQRQNCLDRGAAAYLTKPLDLVEIFELIENVRVEEPLVAPRTL
jgi:PAS domain S-box-containing protein